MKVIPIIKVVSTDCNLRCRYCYYHEEDQSKNRIMNLEILEELIKKTLDNFSGRISFIWHGGEPLLAGINFYRKVLELQRIYRKDCHKIINGIQTNATLLTKKWVNFLKDNSFEIGVSCDGPEHHHDAYRRDRQNNGTFQKVLKGIKLLQSEGIRPHAIMMVTKGKLNFSKEIYDFFYESNLPFHPKPCFEFEIGTGSNGLSDYSVTPEEYANFMMEIFNLWIKTDDPNFRIRNLNNILIGLLGGRPSLCEFNNQCQKFLTVDYNGDIGPCDSFPLREFNFGNILKDDWLSALESEDYRRYLECIELSREDCKNCKWSMVCKGGCLRYSYSKTEERWHKNAFCDSRKKLFTYISKKLEKMKLK